MHLGPIWVGRLARGAAIFFAGLAVLGTAEILWAPAPSRWVALATLTSTATAAAFTGLWAQQRRLSRHRVRILSERCTLTFRPNPGPEESGSAKDAQAQPGPALARGRVRIESIYQSLQPGLSSLRLQKFVIEPSGLDPQALLKSWNYGCRVDAGGRGPGGGDPVRRATAVAAFSDSRSLQIDVALPEPMAPGRRFTVTEELDFIAPVNEAGASFMFQVAYPTRSRTVVVVCEGLRPERAEYRIDHGQGFTEGGPVGVGEPEAGRYRIAYTWEGAEVGQELGLHWRWEAASLAGMHPVPESPGAASPVAADRAGAPAMDRMIVEAMTGQDKIRDLLAARLAAEISETDGAADGAREADGAGRADGAGGADGAREADGETTAGASAEDHPIIKAARAREALYRGKGED